MLEPFLGKSAFANHGQRVVEGQRLMQASSDIMLGWLHDRPDGAERDYIRQLWDAKGSSGRVDGPGRHDRVRQDLRLDIGQGARPLRRRDRTALTSLREVR